MTDIEDLKTDDFRDSPTKTPKITVPCPPFIHMGTNLAGPFEVLREKARMATRRTPKAICVRLPGTWHLCAYLLAGNTHRAATS